VEWCNWTGLVTFLCLPFFFVFVIMYLNDLFSNVSGFHFDAFNQNQLGLIDSSTEKYGMHGGSTR